MDGGGWDELHYATMRIKVLEQDNIGLKNKVEHLLKCCDFTKDGKPVIRGTTLYLYPNNDINREPMKLKVQARVDYCWFESPHGHAESIKNEAKDE